MSAQPTSLNEDPPASSSEPTEDSTTGVSSVEPELKQKKKKKKKKSSKTGDSSSSSDSKKSKKSKKKKSKSSKTSISDIDPNKPKFIIKSWNGVALWAWDIVTDTCAICRNSLMDKCIECQSSIGTATEEECSVAWGVCNHAFHTHCITRWVSQRQTCPLDNRDWEWHKIGK